MKSILFAFQPHRGATGNTETVTFSMKRRSNTSFSMPMTHIYSVIPAIQILKDSPVTAAAQPQQLH